MGAELALSELMTHLTSEAAVLGLETQAGSDTLRGAVESIRAKWFLGGRKVSYRMSCRLEEAARIVHFREAVTEKSWGVPPPTFTVETTTVSGWSRSGSRTDRSVGGGGTVDYGEVREALKESVTAAGWRFDVEGGRMP